MIFLDNASTTKVNKNAILEFETQLQNFYNPSASYSNALSNKNLIESCKESICDLLHVKFNENLLFTGSATEADNLAIFGSAKKKDLQYVFTEGEHLCVYNCALELKNRGYDVVFVPLNKDGKVDVDVLVKVLEKPTAFMSAIHVSNETGAINDIEFLSNLLKSKWPNAIFHSDGVQAFGNIDVNLGNLKNVDLYTISSHKMGGLKGIGALFVRNKSNLKPIIFGGGQEYGLRPGTENLPAICSFKVACLEKFSSRDSDFRYVSELNKIVRNKFLCVSGIKINSPEDASPYILSVSLVGVRGETIVRMCDDDGLLIGTGSACSSKKTSLNRILQSMGKSKEENEGAIRISFSSSNTKSEIEQASDIIINNYLKLRNQIK